MTVRPRVGFTLVEILIVTCVLALIVFPLLGYFSAIAAGPVKGPSKDAEGRWCGRYAYYASAGSYEHYSALELTIDLVKGTLETRETHDAD